MRVCIGGKNNIAVAVCKHIKDIYPQMSLFTTLNRNDSGVDREQLSLRAYSIKNKIPIVRLEDVYSWDDLVFLSLEYDRIVNPGLFKSSQLFNIHFSLLPKYRGVYTSAWPILNGEKESGVTLHLIDAGIDSGDIIAQKSFPLSTNETARSLYSKYLKYGSELVKEWLPSLLAETYPIRKQPLGGSYYSRKTIDYSNLTIDLNQPAEMVDRQIRAFSFRAFQLPKVYGIPVLYTGILEDKSVQSSGTVVKVNEAYMDVATSDYNIRLYKDRFEKIKEFILKDDFKGIRGIKDLQAYSDECDVETGADLLELAKQYGRDRIIDLLLQNGFGRE